MWALEEAVNNKAILSQAVEHAESLLNQQVEADFHKTFQKETKQLLLQAAKARADLVGQVENVVRHRGVAALRAPDAPRGVQRQTQSLACEIKQEIPGGHP